MNWKTFFWAEIYPSGHNSSIYTHKYRIKCSKEFKFMLKTCFVLSVQFWTLQQISLSDCLCCLTAPHSSQPANCRARFNAGAAANPHRLSCQCWALPGNTPDISTWPCLHCIHHWEGPCWNTTSCRKTSQPTRGSIVYWETVLHDLI